MAQPISTTYTLITPRYVSLSDMVSHELKSPLTAIKIYAELIEQSPKQSPDLVSKIDQKVDNLTNLVNDFNDLSKIQTGIYPFTPTSISFMDLLNQSQDILRENHNLTYRIINQDNRKVTFDTSIFPQVLSRFGQHLVTRLSPDNHFLHLVITSHPDHITLNILNPSRELDISRFSPIDIDPSLGFVYYNDIETSWSNQVIRHFGGWSALVTTPSYGYVYCLAIKTNS